MLSCASLPDQLVAACSNGDIWAAKGLIDVGAVVNDKGSSSYNGLTLPLAAAVFQEHYSCVVLLLSHGADPNGEKVMSRYYGAWSSTSAIFQLLIDSGGDVNRDSNHLPPLFGAVSCYSHRRGDVLDRMRVLLAEPRLDVAATRRFASKLNPMTAVTIRCRQQRAGVGCCDRVRGETIPRYWTLDDFSWNRASTSVPNPPIAVCHMWCRQRDDCSWCVHASESSYAVRVMCIATRMSSKSNGPCLMWECASS